MREVLYNSYSDNCCGYCHFHKCAITVKQMRKKECLKKQCNAFEKNEKHQFWLQRQRIHEKRDANRAQQKNAQRNGYIDRTLNMPPHIRLSLLRKGEDVLCRKCKAGLLQPVGDRAKTNTFICPNCNAQLIVD